MPLQRPSSAPAATTSGTSAFSFRAAQGEPAAPSAGSAPVSEALVDLAWAVLAGSDPHIRHVSASALAERLRLFQPTATLEDALFLTGGEKVLSKEDLCTLLVGNTSLCLLFDPLREVVAGGALGAPGQLTFAHLRRALAGLKSSTALTDAAWETLLAEGDSDKDGTLQLGDVRGLVSSALGGK